MSSTGYIQARAFTSSAQLPLKDVAIVITATDGTAIAMRLTDSSGLMRAVEIPVPDKSESQEPNPAALPYAVVNLYAHLEGYELVESKGLQVFPGTTTFQALEMIPLSEFPELADEMVVYRNPPQDL